MVSDDELDMIETERILDALARRFTMGLVICSSRPDPKTGHEDFGVIYRGHPMTCLGLASWAPTVLKKLIGSRISSPEDQDKDQGN